METRKTRAKRPKLELDEEFVADFETGSVSSQVDPDDENEQRKSRIRESNKEFARRMTVLQRWSEHWSDYTTREGDAYPLQEAKAIIKKAKKIACPIAACGKTFTSIGGLKYHYARCKIERCFKCKVCNPPTQLTTRGELLRHMILNHYYKLPTLDAEQKEIANSILFCHRSEKKDKKVSSDTELLNNGLRLVRSYEELLKKCYSKESLDARPFNHWQLSNRHWELITKEMDRRKFYPPESESVHFKSSLPLNNNNNESSRALKTGESCVLNDNPSSFSTVFFTGGVNTCSAWLPKSHFDSKSKESPELVAVSVMCSSMDQNLTYRDSHEGEMCIQFWTLSNVPKKDKENQLTGFEMTTNLSYMIAFNYGIVFDMQWCPLGTSWVPQTAATISTGDTDSSGPPRIGLLAVGCGDGRIRILAVPSTDYLLAKTYNRTSLSTLDATPIFRVKPVAVLMPPGVGQSGDCQMCACKSISWNLEDSQRLIIAGYENGSVAIFDLSNYSPILYSQNDSGHIFHPLKSWIAHGAPVTGVAISSQSIQKIFVATGSIDRQLKLWNPMDLHSCITSDRAPITKIVWDFRFRGVITATDTAFTSFNNRVIYRYPVVDGNHNITLSIHRSTVWGLSNSYITGATATSDCAGEVFVSPQLISRPFHKRDRSVLCTHSIYTMLPYDLDEKEKKCITTSQQQDSIVIPEHLAGLVDNGATKNTAEPQPPEPSLSEEELTVAERQLANKPSYYLLPIENKSVETYSAFKDNYGVEFVHYDQTVGNGSDSKLPESCSRAGEAKFIYCDRPCDYPFCSMNCVSWSPNIGTFPYLLSASQIGLCRLDKIQIVDQIFKGFVDSLFEPDEISTSNVNT